MYLPTTQNLGTPCSFFYLYPSYRIKKNIFSLHALSHL